VARDVKYRLVAETSGFKGPISEAQKQWNGFKSSLATGIGIGGGFALGEKAAEALVGAVKAIPAAMAASIASAAKLGSELSDLSSKTGLSVKAIQEYSLAAKLTGTSTESIATAVKLMQKNLVDGDTAFKQLGLSASSLVKMAPDRAFAAVAEAVRGISNPTQQAAAALAVFGRSGTDILPAIKAGFASISAEAERMGLILSDRAVAAADKLDDETTKLIASWDALSNQFGAAAISGGGITEVVQEMQAALAELTKFVVANKVEIAAFFNMMADGAKFAITGMRGLAYATKSALSGLGGVGVGGDLGAFIEGHLASARAGSGLSGGAVHRDASGRPVAQDLAGAQSFVGKLGDAHEQAARRALAAWKRAAEEARQAWRDFLQSTASFGPGLDEGTGGFMGMPGVGPPVFPTTDQWTVSDQAMQLALARQGVLDAGASFEKENLTRFSASAKGATTETEKWVQALSMAAHAMSLLGIAADSTFGRALSGAASGAAMGAQIGGGVGAAIGGGIGLLAGLFGGGGDRAAAQRQRREQEIADMQRRMLAAREMRGRGVEGLVEHGAAFFAQHRPAPGTVMTEDDARRQGALFAAAWGTVVKERGIVAAADAFKDVFKNMADDLKAAGIELPEWFKQISGQMDLGLDEGFRAVAEAAFTAAKFLEAFAEAGGILNAETLAAFEQEARAAFAGGKGAALALGQDEAAATKAGFAAANPLLKALLNESIVSGVTLSADIQELIRQSGITPSVDVQMLEETRAIRRAVEALAGMGGSPLGPLLPGVPGIPPGGNRPGQRPPREFGFGGRVEFDPEHRLPGGRGLAILHENETVIPAGGETVWAQKILDGKSNFASIAAAQGSIFSELRTLQKAIESRPAVTVQAPISVDTTGLPRGSHEAMLDLMEQRVHRVLRSARGRQLIRSIAEGVTRSRS
jgi:hypothetical protein